MAPILVKIILTLFIFSRIGCRCEKEYELPRISADFSEGLTIKEGDSVKLECSASGYPIPNITWDDGYNNHGAIIKNDIPGKSTLEVTSFVWNRIDYQTPFDCEATNAVGSDRKRKTMTIHFRPRMTVTAIYSLDRYVDFTCSIYGNPPPSEANITWWRGDTLLQENFDFQSNLSINKGSQLHYSTYHYEIESHLRIRKIGKENYCQYACKVTNELGSTKKFYKGQLVNSEDDSRPACIDINSGLIQLSSGPLLACTLLATIISIPRSFLN